MRNPTHAVVGCSDLDATAAFLRPFGFETEARGALSDDVALHLYGARGALQEWRVAVPGAAHGFLRLVETREAARALTTFDPRAFAIDLFTRDIERSLEVARRAGGQSSRIAEHKFGPIVIREAEVHGPDGLVITLLHLHGRRPSLLDQREDLLHSEVHSFVYSVHGIDRVAPFWQEAAGLKKVTDARFGGTSLSIAMGLKEREISARFVVFTDAADQPMRVQLIEFLGEGGHPAASFPLYPGLHAVAFEVDDLAASMAALSTARFGEIITADGVLGRGRAVTGCAPGDLRFELWERR